MFSINNTFIFLILYLHPSFGYQYCGYEDELCKGKPHVACINFAPNKEASVYETITPAISLKLRKEILEIHNYYRNETAFGKLYDAFNETYPQATKMHELTWDFELEYLAKIMTQRCHETEYLCRNSFRFRNIGQNRGVLDMKFEDQKEIIPVIHIEEQLENWFEKHLIVDVNNIEKLLIQEYDYLDFIMEAQRTSFLLMVSDRVKQVGCALSYCVKDNAWRIQVICNYSNDLIVGKPVYKIGVAASDCEKKSETFAYLCAGELKSVRDYEEVSND